jgi:L-fuculose-phosphate aldolase
MSILHIVPETKLYAAAYDAIPKVGLAEYAMPGTMGLVDYVGDIFEQGYDAAILKNHAAFLGSRLDIFDAVSRFEEMDFAGQLFIHAYALDTPKAVSEEQLSAYRKSLSFPLSEFVPQHVTSAESLLRKELAGLSQRAYQRGLFTGFNGVISARVDDSSFIIARSGRDNACLTEEDFVRIKDGKREAGMQPDASAGLHHRIYKTHPDINTIIIAAPVYSMTFAVTGHEYNVYMIPESYGVLRSCIRYPFDTLLEPTELIDNLSLKNPFALVQNYGVVLAGPTPILAFDKLEVCEFSAQSIHQTKLKGGQIHYITKKMMEELDSQ